ncbi:hypothetical protein [Rugamonas sp.]|uniref:hypothetical protein n=1 Tax=Rugamonas sp. TaxID=1926287 RepID=UPI0025D458D9|nr:hypothetical protein [Rugamonas sp.]
MGPVTAKLPTKLKSRHNIMPKTFIVEHRARKKTPEAPLGAPFCGAPSFKHNRG